MRSGAALKTMMGVIPKEEQEAPSLPMERETLVMQGEQAETPPPPPKPTLAEENARLRARVAAQRRRLRRRADDCGDGVKESAHDGVDNQ